MSKKVKSNLYMLGKITRDAATRELTLERDPQGFLFSDGRYRTKILPEDLPEWYVYGYMYKQHGYISAKGVKHLLYIPNYTFDNHLHKYDSLFISYNEPIEPHKCESGFNWYKGYDHILSGSVLTEFVEAAGKYSDYDIGEIQREIARKKEFYYERNPEQAKARYKSPLSEEFGRRLPYRGRDYLLVGAGGRKAFFDDCFCIPVNYSDDQIKTACVKIYRDLARRDLAEKMQEYAEKMNVKPSGLKINGAKTSLGNCSANKVLSFSWRLITSDDGGIIDYVVVSALAHIIEPNRSLKYWALVENILLDYKERQRRLRIFQEQLKSEDWI